MSACERCWHDAVNRDDRGDISEIYRKLLTERQGANQCTPEQQAGPNAGICIRCGRETLHQFTHECMACRVTG